MTSYHSGDFEIRICCVDYDVFVLCIVFVVALHFLFLFDFGMRRVMVVKMMMRMLMMFWRFGEWVFELNTSIRINRRKNKERCPCRSWEQSRHRYPTQFRLRMCSRHTPKIFLEVKVPLPVQEGNLNYGSVECYTCLVVFLLFPSFFVFAASFPRTFLFKRFSLVHFRKFI